MVRLACLTFVAALVVAPTSFAEPAQAAPPKPAKATSAEPSGHLTEQDRLAIIRYVDGEFAHAVLAIPLVKSGFRVRVGRPVDRAKLRDELRMHLIAANPGDKVQITRIAFRRKEIVVDINGGSKKHTPLSQHIQIGFGTPFPQVATTTTTVPIGPPGLQLIGATLILDYGRPLPNLSPAQVKKDLSTFLDFAGERSAAVNWINTLPPNIREAIAQKRAVVGMTHDQVLAAMGRPDQKVREHTPEGVETEDWIYGYPPEKTVFVTFVGDQVVRVKQVF
jgi:hypothetical protein